MECGFWIEGVGFGYGVWIGVWDLDMGFGVWDLDMWTKVVSHIL